MREWNTRRMTPQDRFLLRNGLREWVDEDLLPDIRLAAREAIDGLVEELALQERAGPQKEATKPPKYLQPRSKHEVRKKPKQPPTPPPVHVAMKHSIVRMLKAQLLAHLKRRWLPRSDETPVRPMG